jgi:argininosuccinate lyase
MKLWGSRFDQDIIAATLDYTQTVDVDARMLVDDLWGSLAHVLMTSRQQVIPEDDGRTIAGALLGLLARALDGRYVLDKAKEDVHLNVESTLIEELGMEVGGKLHTARSRNDQVVTDCRLHVRGQLLGVADETVRLAEVLLDKAEHATDTIVLGYTHSQAAQPVSFGFWLSGHASALTRDVRRLLHAFETVNENPLGGCALAGTSFPINRTLTTRLLGFGRTLVHALDATSARDFLAETTAALAILATNVSRLAEEIVVWSSFEYRLVEVADQFATGSSIMPQKKNPVVAELARARAGTVIGCLVELLTVIKGVSLGYSCDLQQDKPPVWRAFDTMRTTVAIMREQVETLKLNAARAEASCWESFSTATELANYLVRDRGQPFRQAYALTGQLVRELSHQGNTLRDLTAASAWLEQAGVPVTEAKLAEIVDPRQVLARQSSEGGTAPDAVRASVKTIRDELEALGMSASSRADSIRNAFEFTREVAARFAGGESLERLLDGPP